VALYWVVELVELFFSVTKCVLCPPVSAALRFVTGSHLIADMEGDEHDQCRFIGRSSTKRTAYAFNNALREHHARKIRLM
jgi:hypothetical protein